MANAHQIEPEVYCRECYYLANDEYAENSDRLKVMNNGIVTCRNCHSGVGGVNPDGSFDLYDSALVVDD